ncbi:putative fatty acid repression mutant protein [Penicillium brasilianum]|uniref:Putative fatty acid repression mutant protein n=1 Tax=Penicillium brasilianum TaxID=104259 RepID=A0A1S9RHS0_PENBI|nr:putative fatty acid repression mutant protein [Penicillium brasilianum]
MSTNASSFIKGMKGRRSLYALTNESTISDDRIEELISEVIKHTPSPFNSQTARLLVLLKEEHERLWDVALEIATATVPAEQLEKLYKPRIAGFRAGYGTVLFYEDPSPLKPLEEKWPMLIDKFPEWSNHSSGMHQFALWTLLEAEGFGCNLQHYSPMIDARVSEQWKIPLDWSLKAQLVFGKPTGGPREKTFEPLEKRVFIHGK